jgi:uncharacterized membrane protein YcaP (DUF421 family)
VDIVIRAAVLFAFIMVLLRLVGRRELAEMEPSDLVLLVVIGDLVQQGITQSDTSMTGAALAISTVALLTVAVSYASYRVRRLRPILDGRPVVLIDDGRVLDENLRAEHITYDELRAEVRGQQIEHLEDVRWAILETSGSVSVIPK